MGKQAMTDIVRVLGAADLLAEIVAASRVGYGDPVTRSNYPASLFHRAVAMLAASPQEAAPTKREAALAELAKLDGETMDLAASPQGGGLQRRVDLNNGGTLEAGGHVDDLSISGEYISLLRLERMNRGSFWGRIYMKDGQDIVLSISAPKGKIDVTAEADQGLPVSPQGEGSSADAPVEAAAWRWLPLLKGKKEPWMEGDATPWVYRTGSEKPDFFACPAGDIIDLQPLYTHPAPIKPSGDTGELRERVAQIIGEAVNRRAPGQIVFSTLEDADAILDLIQSERAG